VLFRSRHKPESIRKMKENLPDRFGKNNSFYGKHHSKESLHKIGLKSLGRQTFLGRKHSAKTKLLISKHRSGKPAWNKGLRGIYACNS
jgi:hypothetical protein